MNPIRIPKKSYLPYRARQGTGRTQVVTCTERRGNKSHNSSIASGNKHMKVHAQRNQKPFKSKEFFFPFLSKSFDLPSLILNRQ